MIYKSRYVKERNLIRKSSEIKLISQALKSILNFCRKFYHCTYTLECKKLQH